MVCQKCLYIVHTLNLSLRPPCYKDHPISCPIQNFTLILCIPFLITRLGPSVHPNHSRQGTSPQDPRILLSVRRSSVQLSTSQYYHRYSPSVRDLKNIPSCSTARDTLRRQGKAKQSWRGQSDTGLGEPNTTLPQYKQQRHLPTFLPQFPHSAISQSRFLMKRLQHRWVLL